jgi:phosphatidylserine decarboxylase
MTTLTQKLFVFFQRLVPQHILTSLVFRLARIRNTGIKNFLIRQFVNAYKVNVEELGAAVPEDFATFNAFFTRALAKGARSIDATAGTIVSPVDGTVSAAGAIERDMLFQAKGMHYGLEDLLATDLPETADYVNGRFATIYLAPYNYHRVHAPLAGTLRAVRYIPGDLFSVNATTALHVPGLFVRNERLVCHFVGDSGPYVLIFVGALNVGSISTPWTGEIRPNKRGAVVEYDVSGQPVPTLIEKGGLLGWFNMGSTVILLLPDGAGEWADSLLTGRIVRMGENIGHQEPRR